MRWPGAQPQLVGAHLLEILGAQHFAAAPGLMRLEFELVRLGLRLVLPALEQALAHAARQGALGLLLGLVGPHLRQHQREHLLEIAGVAPEHDEGLVEDLPLAAPVDEHGMQRPIERLGIFQTGGQHGFRRPNGLLRADREPGRPQEPHELDDVLGDPAAVDMRGDEIWRQYAGAIRGAGGKEGWVISDQSILRL